MPRFGPFAATLAASLCFVLPLASSAAAQEALPLDPPLLGAAPLMAGVVDGSWKGAAQVPLSNDFTYRRAVDEKTEVFVAQDDAALDVAFVVHERENVLSGQETNSSSVLSDDYVIVYLWPQGTQGFQYSFAANPRGARYQTSSENSAYSPQ